MESHHILHDLGWLMVAAAVVSMIFRGLKQPAIIGYLVAGLLLGPHVLPVSPLSAPDDLNALSELGVLFLMFYIGLEFDLGKLRPVAGAAVLGLTLQTALMVLIGITAGQWLGWSAVEGLFLGGILAISSSMVCFKLIGERGEMHRPYAQLAAGVLILEDILAIVLLVVLAGVAVSGRLDVGAVGKTTFFVGMFVVAVFVIGKLLAPKLVGLLHKIGNAETVTLFTVGLIFAVSLLAAEAHFSLALGSFLAGAILSRSSIAHEIEGLTAPLRDFFSALFFVTIGTVIDPGALWEHLGAILVITAVMMTGKFVTCWTGFVLAAVPPPVATRASLAKVQIGEFGFVIAALAISLGVTNPALKAIATGVAVLSITLTPLAFSLQKRLNDFGAARMPVRLRGALRVYLDWIGTAKLALGGSSFLLVVRRPLLRVGLDFLLLNALIIVVSLAARFVPGELWGQRAVWLLGALVSILFLVDILRSLDVITLALAELAMSRPALRFLSQGPVCAILRWVAFSLILVAFAALFLAASAPYFPTGASLALFALAAGVMLSICWRRAVHIQSQLEFAVISSLEAQARSGTRAAVEEAVQKITRKHPWPVELAEIIVPAGGLVVGKTLRQINLRADTGATIVALERGGTEHYEVPPDLPLFPGDHLLLVGEREQLDAASLRLNELCAFTPEPTTLPHTFKRVLVTGASGLCGLTLREAGIRAKYGVTVLGVQRDEIRRTGLPPDEILQDGDLLLVMGREEGITGLREALLGS
ncbi:MAG: cation:proton antiporter [Verrucomicrobiota bacterium]